ncbi:MAG: biotin synthase, partial [Alphaproteobacteria bacterium]|nr:biotin synthase [Alphaproteobacteria bacterium]
MTTPDAADIRYDWTVDEIVALHDLPLLELVGRANEMHRRHHDSDDIQRASLLSIKTGGCPENCKYCAQSAHWRDVELERERMMDV